MACSVRVCCLCLTWQDSGTMLWLCLLFHNALGSPAQRTQLALPSGRESSMGKIRLTETEMFMKSSALCSSIFCYWSKQDIKQDSSKNMLFQANITTLILDFTASSIRSTSCHGPGSSYCSVKIYHNHWLLLARAVLRSAKISWTPCSRI